MSLIHLIIERDEWRGTFLNYTRYITVLGLQKELKVQSSYIQKKKKKKISNAQAKTPLKLILNIA